MPDEGPGARGDRRRDQARGGPRDGGRRVNLTADNTAIVLDSTADFPERSRALPELARRSAVRQLRHRELPRRRRPDRGGVLRAPAHVAASCRRRRSRRRATSSPCYEELAGYERILSLHLAANLSGTFQSAGTAAAELGDGRVRTIDTETASVGITLLALAIQRRLERGTTDEEVDALVERYKARARTALHRRHARVPRARRPHRPREGVRRRAAAREADPVDPRRRGDPDQARARRPQGVPGVRRRARVGDEGRARRCASASRTRRRRSAPSSSRRWCAICARRRRSTSRRASAR